MKLDRDMELLVNYAKREIVKIGNMNLPDCTKCDLLNKISKCLEAYKRGFITLEAGMAEITECYNRAWWEE